MQPLFNYGARIGLIPSFEQDRAGDPITHIYTEDELFKLEQYFREKDFYEWLTFMLFRFTGARRSSVARRTKTARNGLLWKDVLWMTSDIEFRQRKNAKKPAFRVPLLPELKKALIEAKEKHLFFNREKHVIPFTRDTVSHKFADANKATGISKPRPVHCIRHTAASRLIEQDNWDIHLLMEWFGWSSMQTALKYVHVSREELQRKIQFVSL